MNLLSDTEWLKCLEVPQCLHTGSTHLMKAQGGKVPTVVSARFWEAFLVVFKIFAQFLVSGFKYFFVFQTQALVCLLDYLKRTN